MLRYRFNPVQWVRDTWHIEDVFDADGHQLAGIWPDQRDFVEAYGAAMAGAGKRQISKVSGHRVGKSTALAWIVWHHAIFFHPQKTRVTAPNEKQLFGALANEVKSWHGKMPPELADAFEVMKEQVVLKAAPHDNFVTFIVSRAEVPEALAGAHSKYPLLIADEASGVPDSVFEAADSVMAGKNGVMILAGNPIRTKGKFYNSHHKMRSLWWTQQVSSENHPNVSPDWVRDKQIEYGVESNRYKIRVLGQFPEGEDEKVIAHWDIDAALDRDVQAMVVQPIWGLDIGRSLRRDSSALAKRKGNVLLEPVRTWHYIDPMQTVGLVKHEWDTTVPSERPSAIVFDVIGEGSGPGYRLLEMGLPMIPVNVAETDPLLEPEKYANLRAELYYKARDFFTRKDSRIGGVTKDGKRWRDEALASELGEPGYKYRSNGKILVESKEDMRNPKRPGGAIPSPNRADAFVLTFAVEAVSAMTNRPSRRDPYRAGEPLPDRGVSYV